MRPLVLCVVLAACARRRDTVAPSEVPALLSIADNQWADRGALGLERVEGTLTEAYRAEPVNPEVLWRLVRLNVARGLAELDPRAALYAFAEARTLGTTCLDQDPLFAQLRAEQGWEAAVATLDTTDAGCASWTALAWSRWVSAHGGAAAALDLEPLDALVSRSVEVATTDTQDVAAWADAVVAAARPPWEGGDPERARRLLDRAIQARPDELWRRLDLMRHASGANHEEVARVVATAIVAAPAVGPEDRAAQQLAAAWLATP